MSYSSKFFAMQAAVCKALGLDPINVARLVLELSAHEPPIVRVTLYLEPEQEQALERVFLLSEWEEASAVGGN